MKKLKEIKYRKGKKTKPYKKVFTCTERLPFLLCNLTILLSCLTPEGRWVNCCMNIRRFFCVCAGEKVKDELSNFCVVFNCFYTITKRIFVLKIHKYFFLICLSVLLMLPLALEARVNVFLKSFDCCFLILNWAVSLL